MRIETTHDVERIREIAGRWLSGCNAQKLGFAISIDRALEDLREWVDTMPGDILLAYEPVSDYDPPELVGFFALFVCDSYLGPDKVALEKYWYAEPNHTRAGVALFRAAMEWSKEHGCSHLIASASGIASDLHDKVCRFFERQGMTLFETAYIAKVE